MKKQRIYISGKMSDADAAAMAQNVEQFHRCAALLRAAGCRPVNPANVWACRHLWLYRLLERLLGKDGAYRLVLVYDLWLLSRSDGLCLIDGWRDSRGARIEEHFAFRIGIVKTHTFCPDTAKLTPVTFGKKKRKKKGKSQEGSAKAEKSNKIYFKI